MGMDKKCETDHAEVKVSDSDGEFKVSEWGIRHQQCIILFFCLTTAYSMRACMGVALVAMIDDSEPLALDVMNYTDTRNISNSQLFNVGREAKDNEKVFHTHGILNALMLVPPYFKFKWNKKLQELIMSSFFWGYMTLQIPAGQLAHRFGSRRLLTGAMSINCIASFFFPWCAYYGGWICAMLCRIVQGLSQACIIPAMHTFFGKWTPLGERARLAGFVMGGQALGTVLGLPITGFIASTPLGWPGIFRFFGVLSGVIAIVVSLLLADTPTKHPKICMAEVVYIEKGLGQKHGAPKRQLPVPWCRMLRSKGLYAIVAAHVGNTWGQLTLYSEVPSFMNKVMGVNIRANGLLTALPFLVMWFTNFFFTWFTDMVIVKKILSPTNARKLANTLGFVPAAIGLVVLAFVPKNIYVVETILVIICSFKIAGHVGFLVNHIDISPNFAGTMLSISNFVSNLVSSQAPLVAGFILTDMTSEYQWRYVFLIAAGFYFSTNLVYVMLGTAEKADWNEPVEPTKDAEDHETLPILVDDKCTGSHRKSRCNSNGSAQIDFVAVKRII